jgi:hypothetical protein
VYRKLAKMMLILGGGVTLGGFASRFHKTPSMGQYSNVEQPAAFHKQQFTTASSIDSVVMLAQQLPKADAQQCAALAQAMLQKRFTLPTNDREHTTHEEQVLPTRVWEGLFKRWMQVAPQAAWAFVGKNHSDELPLRIAALRQWALLDPMAAAKAAGSALTKEEQYTIAKACIEMNPAIGLNLLVEWGVDFSDSYTEAFTEDEPYSLGDTISALLEKYAEKSLRAALEFCQLHAPKLVSDVCAGWMRQDAAKCFAWIQELPVEQQKEMLLSLAAEADVKAETVRRLAGLCEPSERHTTILFGISSIAKNDASAAQSLIDELLSNPADRFTLRCDIAGDMVQADPRKAMDFMMPSLSEPLPIFSNPGFSKDFSEKYRGWGTPFVSPSMIFTDYLELGSAAGVTNDEILRRLHDIHPPYREWLMDDSFYILKYALGNPSEWMPALLEKTPPEFIRKFVGRFDHASSEQVIKEMNSAPKGAFRDALAQRSLEMMLQEDAPMANVLAKAQEWGGDLDWSDIYYFHWMEQSPEEVVSHLLSRRDAKESEWEVVIREGYETHAQVLENAVEKMHQGPIRDTSLGALSSAAMENNRDVVTSMYWATEMMNRSDRSTCMKLLWSKWQDDEKLSIDPQVIEGVRQNIDNSSLDMQEKALWLDRLESEVER